jgi:quercetin dioxygenase-like cupin family protein
MMSTRPYIVRKWTDGKRGVAESDQVQTDTYDNNLLVPKLLEGVDPAAAERYRSQMRNKTLNWFRILSPDETEHKYGVFYVTFTSGSDFPNHYHKAAQATLMIVEGTGYVILDGKRHEISAGDVVHIPPGVAHEFFVAREGERFAYVSITEPDVVLDPGKHIDWYTVPSVRYAEDGTVQGE